MDVKLPNLGEGADSGTVVTLFVKEGDQIKTDQPVLELENEKAVATIPSTADGVVAKVHVKVGDKVSVGQRIVSVSAEGEQEAKPPERARQPATPDSKEVGTKSGPAVAEKEEADSEEEGGEERIERHAQPVAPPSIRRLGRELGIDLTKVQGSARGGRIVMADLRAYIQRLQKLAARPGAAPAPPAAKPAADRVDFSKWGAITRAPLSQLRKVIGRRMSASWSSIPRVTQFDEADISGLLDLRQKYVAAYEKQGTRLTLTSFVLKSSAAVLKKHPILNSSLDEVAEEIVYKEYCHIGIAVDTEAGLIVPLIRDADKKNLLKLSKELEEMAKKARERRVSADELKGGSFTISNQGGIGGAHFTPIINYPEVAILGLGRGVLKPVVRDGQIAQRTMLPLALSYDHRVIDGGAAARFTVDLVRALENFSEDAVKI